MKKLFLIMAILALAAISYSQVMCNPDCEALMVNSINISTGWDPGTSSLLAAPTDNSGSSGSIVIDPLWKLINIPPLEGGAPAPATVAGPPTAFVIPYWTNYYGTSYPTWNEVPNSRILSANNYHHFGHDNAIEDQPWRFNRYFCVCDEQRVTINIAFRADDYGEVVLLDLNSTPIVDHFLCETIASPACWSTRDTTLTFSLSPGIYAIQFRLRNEAGVAMGFALEGTVTTSEEVLMDNSPECCSFSSIHGQKLIDDNCDGVSDSVGIGWTFNLLDGSTVVATATTNSFGEFSFIGVDYGTYTIEEMFSGTGCTPMYPSGGDTTITVSVSNPIVNAGIFLNCCEEVIEEDCCNFDYGIEVGSGLLYEGSGYYLYRQNVTVNAVPLISSISASIVHFDVNYNYDDCANCYTDDFALGSFKLPFSDIGGLHYSPVTYPASGSIREVFWESGSGADISSGASVDVIYTLPFLRDIECCADSVQICTRWSFMDFECNFCDTLVCEYVVTPRSETGE